MAGFDNGRADAVPRAKDFVKCLREGLKVIIIWRGGNSFGWFLEVAVYVVGARRGLILIPEGWEGWGWSRFAAKLGKVSTFVDALVGVRPGMSSPVDKKLGKEVGSGLGLGSI
jgi:hypothetical protein